MALAWTRWVCASVVGAVVGCGSASAFLCESDSDCVLTGTPGVCQDNGRCAYPDDNCASGLAYPVATPDVGGTCVDGGGTGEVTGGDSLSATDGASGGGTGGGGETRGGGETGESTISIATGIADDTASMTSAGSTAAESDSGSLSTDSDDATDETGNPCPDEVGDAPFSAMLLGGCTVLIESELSSASDQDWFGLLGPGANCTEGGYGALLELPEGFTAEVCLAAGCEGGEDPTVTCASGNVIEELVGGIVGCCSEEAASGQFSCSGDPFDPFVIVRGASSTCVSYAVEVLLTE